MSPKISQALYFKKLDPRATTPTYANPGDAGADLYALEGGLVMPNQRCAIKTGIAVSIPEGYAGLVLPRSGLARKHGVTLANAPGLVDAGYRGELVCITLNTSDVPYMVQSGDRIAQLVIIKVEAPAFIEVGELAESERGVNGFGSTGR